MTKRNQFNILPVWIKNIETFLSNKKIPAKIIFITISVLSTIWFLVRVIPKPVRATYPCMQIAAPAMSSFIIWIIAVTASWFSFKKAGTKFVQAKYLAASAFVIVALVFAFASFTNNAPFAKAYDNTSWIKPNMPVGEARGIFPGRVAWAHNPKIASWDLKTGNWWEDRFVNQAESDKVIKDALLQLTNDKDPSKAWNQLFVFFNQKKHNSTRGYQKNEKIAIKINQNNTYSHADSPEINATPQLVLSLLKSLVNDAGVPQKNITLFDASRFITDHLYNTCHNAFPDVVFVDNIGGNGRVKSLYKYDAIPYSIDNGHTEKGLATCVTEASYIINMALLKGHVSNGTTFCAKNFYGALSIHADWRKNKHINFNQDRNGKFIYSSFTDYMGHKDLGEKTMLFIIDAIYGNKIVDQAPQAKMKMPPFNGSWPNSVFFSQDGVAIDAVGTDFVINEWPDAPDLKYCDMYLYECALANKPLSGTFYDPERDGTGLPSLGVFEHWNNATDKKYSRNLETGNGIELVYKLVD
jgi:hypothetical protein